MWQEKDVVDCEMKLAFYDDSTRALMVLEMSDGSGVMGELQNLVQETVRLEALVVGRHGSQLMRAPAFARRPNSGMLTAPDGSGVMRACPTVESRLRLLRARLALAEHPSTQRTHISSGIDIMYLISHGTFNPARATCARRARDAQRWHNEASACAPLLPGRGGRSRARPQRT